MMNLNFFLRKDNIVDHYDTHVNFWSNNPDKIDDQTEFVSKITNFFIKSFHSFTDFLDFSENDGNFWIVVAHWCICTNNDFWNSPCYASWYIFLKLSSLKR